MFCSRTQLGLFLLLSTAGRWSREFQINLAIYRKTVSVKAGLLFLFLIWAWSCVVLFLGVYFGLSGNSIISPSIYRNSLQLYYFSWEILICSGLRAYHAWTSDIPQNPWISSLPYIPLHLHLPPRVLYAPCTEGAPTFRTILLFLYTIKTLVCHDLGLLFCLFALAFFFRWSLSL